jgi:hypothetical protein
MNPSWEGNCMKWKWSDHFVQQMKERKIPRELVEEAISHPDSMVHGMGKRVIYQRIAGKRLLRVVTEEDILVTVYLTTKIEKYME